MARRGIDMLPLLDVFMVVLFVFATIQEQQIDSSAQELDELQATLARATLERDSRAERVEQLAAELAELETRSERRAAREQQLQELVEAYERECGPRRGEGPVCPAAAVSADAKQQAEMAALHERLLDNVAVFEIEIEGEPDLSTGKIRNRCCWRADPPAGEWQSCGELPGDELAQLAWLDEGGSGLLDGLSRTRGGKAVVLLRQGVQARWRISNNLAELLREQMPSHRIYDDGTSTGPPRCPLLQP
ncbi:MAG: hypothetical protein R6X02_18810 [Enhygromyxa sp.]